VEVDQTSNLSAIARQCSVGWEFVKKIETELNEHGRVLHPSEVYLNREQEGGPGSRSLYEDVVSVWNRHANNVEVIERVRDCIKKILSLPNNAYLEYKPHVDSFADKSSFRNTTVWRPKSGGGAEGGGGGGNGGPPRRMPSWGEREDNAAGKERGNSSKPVRSEVQRARR
jgi:hypothetical protein